MNWILNAVNRLCIMLIGCEDPLKGLDGVAADVALLKPGPENLKKAEPGKGEPTC